MRVLSPRMRAAGQRLEGIDGEHRDALACAISCRPSASMKVDLPTPGAPRCRSGSRGRCAAAARRAACCACARCVGARRFDQRDRLGQRPPVAGEHAGDHGVDVGCGGGHRRGRRGRDARSVRPAEPRSCAPRGPWRSTSARAVGDRRAGAVDAGDAGRVERRVVLRRDDAADERPGCRRRPARAAPRPVAGTSVLWPPASVDTPIDVHVVLDRPGARPPPASGTAGRCRRRSRGRRRRWR